MAIGPYKEYLTHDNGGSAFLVRYNSDTFWVFKQGGCGEVADPPDGASQKQITRWIKSFFKELVMTSPYMGVIVGKSGGIDHYRLETGSHYVGNSILFFMPDGRCLCVAANITAFMPPEPIIYFKSPVIGCDVSYPYAVGASASYLFLEGCFVPHSDLSHPKEFPYHVAYMHDVEGAEEEDRTYIKSHMIQGFEELVERDY